MANTILITTHCSAGCNHCPQHPQISAILEAFTIKKNPFRIATGGFIDLTPWIGLLERLNREGSLNGISMGTDVLTRRVDSPKWVPIWKNNIELLSQHNIPYSLTLTIEPALIFDHLDVWNWTNMFTHFPEFIYLIQVNKNDFTEWVEHSKNVFKIDLLRD